MSNLSVYKHATVKIYHGYGHTQDLVIYGHVFLNKQVVRRIYAKNLLQNIIHLLRLFFIRPVSGALVELQWRNQIFTSTTEKDGFFKFEWKSDDPVTSGWHPVKVRFLHENGSVLAQDQGKIYVPHKSQFAFISDIDDTILISHSATIFKRLRVLFTQNPHTRKSFEDVKEHYKLLASSNTNELVPNPFFYVSSSEWNLYDDLTEFFHYNGLPEGVFLLNAIKRWYQLLKTGKTRHAAKILKIARILESFPIQTFILLGDNSQSDPEIYLAIVKKYPRRIFAVYIRNIVLRNESKAKKVLAEIKALGSFTFIFKKNSEALAHSREIGLIN
jgi:phosphatidate phosphatase APP1